MADWKLPPKAKIYEALSAVADGRVALSIDDNQAGVTSSSGTKTYNVMWNDDISAITSNDNASYWHGYLGYPILAALMVQKKLQYDKKVAELMAGINWKQVNRQHHNNYDKAVAHVLKSLEEKGADAGSIRQEVDRIFAQIEHLGLQKLSRIKRPPEEHWRRSKH
ncbi:MAG: hypothetical protein JW920_09880 [Deltaproteobacteria bacterium]|nr:hypothetical protein [Deltaproteobacteria bacterium]